MNLTTEPVWPADADLVSELLLVADELNNTYSGMTTKEEDVCRKAATRIAALSAENARLAKAYSTYSRIKIQNGLQSFRPFRPAFTEA